MMFTLHSRTKTLVLDRPQIMGILNVTPDSFSDGGRYDSVAVAVARALEMVEQGATVIDVGGESTGPGSATVALAEELDRVVPVVEAVRAALDEAGQEGVWISVDTWKSEVARRALEAGADMVNDVTAGRGDEAIFRVVAEAGVPMVLMYAKDDTPRTTGEVVEYDDVVATVSAFLEERMAAAERARVARAQLVLDPGMGAFVSARAAYSLELLERLREFESLGQPLLVGASRKSFIREIWGGDRPSERLEGSLMSAAIATLNGVHFLRVHDVAETRQMLDFVERLI